MGFQWCGLGHTKQGRLSSGVARATRMETFNQKVMEHESTQCGNFVKAHVFAVWPGPHALTTRVKRCGQGHTGFQRCGPGYTEQYRLSSGVARATRVEASILYPGRLGTVSGRFLPSKSVRGVAWATRIDNEGQTVWAGPHGISTVWPWPHETRPFVKRCGQGHTRVQNGGSFRANKL